MSEPAVCVFAASSLGVRSVYLGAASSLGKAIAKAKRPLVYGGGTKGLMGAASRSCIDAGGKVIGVIPYAMIAAGGEGYGNIPGWDGEGVETIVVQSMHERKEIMANKAEGGFIALPGGFGTFEEILEMITWTQLGIHRKPVVLLNIESFFSPLRTMIHDAVDAGFIPPGNIDLAVFVEPTSGDAAGFDWGEATMDALARWKYSPGPRNFDWTLRAKAEDAGEELRA